MQIATITNVARAKGPIIERNWFIKLSCRMKVGLARVESFLYKVEFWGFLNEHKFDILV